MLTEAVRGSSRTVCVSESPPESVAVSAARGSDGYSWSGATNAPLAGPCQLWTAWVWQFDGQCCDGQRPDRAEAGSVPSCSSRRRAAGS